MRRLVDIERLQHFMQALGDEADNPAEIYFTGGATAMLLGWRQSTIDIDIKLIPESDSLYRALPRLKDLLEINVELASPPDFIPELPGWRARSSFISRHGAISYFHFDLYSQCLAKIERGHTQDIDDVRQMIRRGHVQPLQLLRYFEDIEPRLYLFPAIDPNSFRIAVEKLVTENAGLNSI
jgi:hypothetical protein